MLSSSNVGASPAMSTCTDVPQFAALQSAAASFRNDTKLHLKHLLADAFRCQGLMAVHASQYQQERRRILLDYSRQQITGNTMELLFDLADRMKLTEKIADMRNGSHINSTERLSVVPHVCRSHPGNHCPAEISQVQARIQTFSEQLRAGKVRGITGKMFKHVLCLSVGPANYATEAVYEALRADAVAQEAAFGMTLAFVSNMDPVDFDLATRDLNAEQTLFVVVGRTWDMVETRQNARIAKRWLNNHLSSLSSLDSSLSDQLAWTQADIVSKHFCAVQEDPDGAIKFGIHPDNIYPLWNWVGTRFSVWSAAGMLPLSLHYSYHVMKQMQEGAHDIDQHFFDSPLGGNIPVLLGLLGVWNSTFMGYPARALLPYSHALRKFSSMVQNFDMESNGKRVTAAGIPLPFPAGEINIGDSGTNAQYSIYQFLHQGRTIPADFIGFMESQSSRDKEYNYYQEEATTSSSDGWDVTLEISSHDELMANFFAQPDALAYGKTLTDLVQEEVPEELRQHKVFLGNRPSSSILLTKLDAFAMGQLIAIYEYRTVVQGFIWGINSFDQYGTELGRVIVKRVRDQLSASRRRGASVQGFNSSSGFLLEAYLSHGRVSR